MRANKKPTQAHDPLLTQIEQELCLGRYISYGNMFDFVRHLEQVEEKLESLVDDGEADWVVHEAAHVFHNWKRAYPNLPAPRPN